MGQHKGRSPIPSYTVGWDDPTAYPTLVPSHCATLMLGSGEKDCVQVYHKDETLVLLNHAIKNSFGGIGFKRLKTMDQFDQLSKMLIKD